MVVKISDLCQCIYLWKRIWTGFFKRPKEAFLVATRLFKNISEKRFFILSFFILIFAYGMYIPWLGFYWDDWIHIFPALPGRFSDYLSVFNIDRPFASWAYIISVPILGRSPIAWHITVIFIRWLASLFVYWTLSQLWPKRNTANWMVAILYGVYPTFFSLQIATVYYLHFVASCLYFLSIGVMLYSLSSKGRRSNILVALALASQMLHLLTMEYFVGLELLRPFFIWLMVKDLFGNVRNVVVKTLKIWLPYAAVFVFYTVWRAFIADLPRLDIRRRGLLVHIANSPAEGLLEFLETMIQSFVYVLGSAWNNALQLSSLTVHDRSDLISWAIGLLAFIFVVFAIQYGGNNISKKNSSDYKFSQAIWLGLAAIGFSFVPFWLIGAGPPFEGFSDRYTIPAMFGASLIWVYLISELKENTKAREIVIGILILLAVSSQVRNANEYRLGWARLKREAVQLSWRAPDIEPDTALVTFGLPPYMADNTYGMFVNFIYPQTSNETNIDYWIYDLDHPEAEAAVRNREILRGGTHHFLAEAEDINSVLFYHVPASGCLWLLTSLDQFNEYLPTVLQELAPFSNLERIRMESRTTLSPERAVFGIPDENSWCFFYEKAALAQQLGNYSQVIQIMEDASQLGFSPNIKIELLPLIEAYARQQGWTKAHDWSTEVLGGHLNDRIMLCAMWESLIFDPNLKVPENLIAWIRSQPDCVKLNVE